jgi:hypothetical protein
MSPATATNVIAVHCADPRFQPHFQRFLREDRGAPAYALLAVPGGPQMLARGGEVPAVQAGWEWMEFLLGLVKPERVILIAHDDCRWYLDRGAAQAATQRETQSADLRRAREALLRHARGVVVELWWARLTDTAAAFDPVEPGP